MQGPAGNGKFEAFFCASAANKLAYGKYQNGKTRYTGTDDTLMFQVDHSVTR